MKYFLLILLISFPAFAVKNIPLKKGVKFIPKSDGLFIPKAAWLKHEKRVRADRKELLKIPLLLQKVNLLETKVALLEQRLVVETMLSKTYKELYTEAIGALYKERLERSKWYNSKALWFAVGFAVSSATYAILKVSDR